MKFVVYGAGGVGGVIGGRLHLAGYHTTLIARGEHGASLQQNGLRLITPESNDLLSLDVVEHPRELHLDEHTVILLCVKSQHTRTALQDLSLCPGSERVAVVCVQNGVANETEALRFFEHVYGCVVNLPAMFLKPGEVVGYASGAAGILDIGRVPHCADPRPQQIASALSGAGFSAVADPNIMRWKYAKLLLNLLNVLQACLHDYEQCMAIRRLVRSEALACFAAANIDCATKQEVQARGTSADGVPLVLMAEVPGYARTAGSSWQSLARGTGDIETEYLNGEICKLGRQHAVPTPANTACVYMARQTIMQGLGANHFSTAELERRIRQLT